MELNSYIDHTNLKKDALIEDIEKLCEEAMKYHFASVCVYPYFVKAVSEYLKGSNVEICTVVGFPNGMNTTNVKVYEAIDAIENGATEIDMVINISALKNKEYDYITRTDIWNYLKINKWCKDVGLTISDMVDDIMMVDIDKVDRFLKEYIKKQERQLVE